MPNKHLYPLNPLKHTFNKLKMNANTFTDCYKVYKYEVHHY